jgi:hypothetical protein
MRVLLPWRSRPEAAGPCCRRCHRPDEVAHAPDGCGANRDQIPRAFVCPLLDTLGKDTVRLRRAAPEPSELRLPCDRSLV